MRTKSTVTTLLCSAFLAAFLLPSVAAQDGGVIVSDELTLYFTDDWDETAGNNQVTSLTKLNCGIERAYNLTTSDPPVDTTPGKAYVNRGLVEANSVLGCETDFNYMAPEALTFAGDARVTFPLKCDRLGVIQPISNSVVISARADGKPVRDGSWTFAGATCNPGQALSVDATIPMAGTELAAGKLLTFRVNVKAVNTEGAVLPYWYIETSPISKVVTSVEGAEQELPECSDTEDNDGDGNTDHPQDPGCVDPQDEDETDSAPPPTPECSDGNDNDADGNVDYPQDPGCLDAQDDDETDDTQPQGDAPNCARDEPAEAEVSQSAGTAFTLTAVCTDPDDDLATGEWTVDDQPVAEEELGESPAVVDEEFTFDQPGTHVIEVTPTDDGGREGEPASWVVHIVDDSGDGDAPSCARDDPPEFDISRASGTPFTLTAVCEDPEDDLESGDWVIDDEPVAEDDLGDSPATADEEFEFTDDDCGVHHIHFVPTDQAGNVGSSATWRVTVACGGDDGGEPTDDPTPTTTPIPVFPSTIAMVLGVAGAMGGGFLILRRRGA